MNKQEKLLKKILFWLNTKNILEKKLNKHFMPDNYMIYCIENSYIKIICKTRSKNGKYSIKQWDGSYNENRKVSKILSSSKKFISNLIACIKCTLTRIKFGSNEIVCKKISKKSISFFYDVGAICFTDTIKFCNTIEFFVNENNNLNIMFSYDETITDVYNLYFTPIINEFKKYINNGNYKASILNEVFTFFKLYNPFLCVYRYNNKYYCSEIIKSICHNNSFLIIKIYRVSEDFMNIIYYYEKDYNELLKLLNLKKIKYKEIFKINFNDILCNNIDWNYI